MCDVQVVCVYVYCVCVVCEWSVCVYGERVVCVCLVCVSGVCIWCAGCVSSVYMEWECVCVYMMCVCGMRVCVYVVSMHVGCVCVCPIVPRPLSFLQSHHFPVASIPHIPSLMRLWTCHVLGKRITILERTAYALEETCR